MYYDSNFLHELWDDKAKKIPSFYNLMNVGSRYRNWFDHGTVRKGDRMWYRRSIGVYNLEEENCMEVFNERFSLLKLRAQEVHKLKEEFKFTKAVKNVIYQIMVKGYGSIRYALECANQTRRGSEVMRILMSDQGKVGRLAIVDQLLDNLYTACENAVGEVSYYLLFELYCKADNIKKFAASFCFANTMLRTLFN